MQINIKTVIHYTKKVKRSPKMRGSKVEAYRNFKSKSRSIISMSFGKAPIS